MTKVSLPLSLCSVAAAPLFSRSFSICRLCSCVSYFLIVASRRPSNDATLRSDSERSSLWRLRRKQTIIELEQTNRFIYTDRTSCRTYCSVGSASLKRNRGPRVVSEVISGVKTLLKTDSRQLNVKSNDPRKLIHSYTTLCRTSDTG